MYPRISVCPLNNLTQSSVEVILNQVWGQLDTWSFALSIVILAGEAASH